MPPQKQKKEKKWSFVHSGTRVGEVRKKGKLRDFLLRENQKIKSFPTFEAAEKYRKQAGMKNTKSVPYYPKSKIKVPIKPKSKSKEEKKHYWLVNKKKRNKGYSDSLDSSFWNTSPENISWSGDKKMYHGSFTNAQLKKVKTHALKYNIDFISVEVPKSYGKSRILNEIKEPKSKLKSGEISDEEYYKIQRGMRKAKEKSRERTIHFAEDI